MRPIIAGCALACWAVALPALAGTCPAETVEEATSQVQAAFADWNAAMRNKELEKTMAIFSESLRFQVQGVPDYGYPRMLANARASFSREKAPLWQGSVESLIGSAEMVTLFSKWTLTPADGGETIMEYRGADVFQRESDCAWRIVASLNYVDAATAGLTPEGESPGPATVRSEKPPLQIAWREPAVRDLDFVFGHH